MEVVANYVSEYIRSLEQSREPILIEMEEFACKNKVPIIEVKKTKKNFRDWNCNRLFIYNYE